MDNELVLVADGDKRIRNLINITLQAHDYKCITANGGENAILLASSNSPGVILMELNLPIIVISSRIEDHDKVMALDAGADEYLTKPFSVEELLAHLRVISRRYAGTEHLAEASPVFQNGGLKVDFASNCVYVNDIEVHLTPIEYKILCMLSHNCGKVLTHTDITKEIWGNSWESTIAILRTFMASLRKKIEADRTQEYIHTHTSVGYRMVNVGR